MLISLYLLKILFYIFVIMIIICLILIIKKKVNSCNTKRFIKQYLKYDNISIDENNNLIVLLQVNISDLWDKKTYTFNIGSNTFEIPIYRLKLCSSQKIVLYKKGISKINTLDIYDINNKSDIIINISIYF